MDNPLCSEIRDVCISQHLNAEVEQQKFYPRELARDHIHSGRVRVQLKNASGQPLNENIKSSEYIDVKNFLQGTRYDIYLYYKIAQLPIIGTFLITPGLGSVHII